MTGALRKLLLGTCARRAAAPRMVPYPGWTTGSDTDAESPEMQVRRATWEDLREASTILWLDGLKVRLFPGNETSRVLFLTGLYEPNEFCWLERYLKPGMTVVDGGANMGLYALYAARRVAPSGAVLALEPSEREFRRLAAHARLNRLGNIRCRRLALGRAAGTGRLRIAAEWNAGHNTLGEFGYEATELVRVEEVEVRALDAIVADERLDRVDLIKLDLEGAEYDALLGAEATIRRYRPAILVEVADGTLRHQGAHSGRIWDFLESRGYALYGFDPNNARLQPAARKPEYDSENLVATPGVGEDRTPAAGSGKGRNSGRAQCLTVGRRGRRPTSPDRRPRK